MASVVVTLSETALPGLGEALADLSVDIARHPLLTFAEPESWDALDQAIARIGEYAACAVTSPRAAAALLERAARTGALRGRVIWATGAATAAVLRGTGADLQVPHRAGEEDEGAAAALARAMLESGIGSPILFACGDRRTDALPAMLTAAGRAVHEVVCYRTLLASDEAARAAVRAADVLVVGSPSVAGLLARAASTGTRPDLLAIGVTTADAASACGWHPAAVASAPTVTALAAGVRALLVTH
jgi:uroporphyrinogen-III synthase